MSAIGIVSRLAPVHTAVRNCTRDEGWPFEVGNQVSENLAGDAKGKSTSGSNREAESSSASRFTAGAFSRREMRRQTRIIKLPSMGTARNARACVGVIRFSYAFAVFFVFAKYHGF